jgi:hypothetical protein
MKIPLFTCVSHLLSTGLVLAQSLISPSHTFDIRTSAASVLPASSRFDAIKIADNYIYVSYTDDSAASRHRGVLQITRSGVVAATISFEGAERGARVAFDSMGNIFALRTMEDRTIRLEKYNINELMLRRTLAGSARALDVVGDTPFLLTLQGSVPPAISPLPGQLRGARFPDLPDHLHFVATDDHTVVVVDPHKPVIRRANLLTQTVTSVAVDAPEVMEAVQKIDSIMERVPTGPKARPLRPLLFFEAVGDRNGHLFLAVAPWQLAEGMRVVEIDGDGRFVRSLRLVPSALARLKREGNPAGWVLQRKLSIAGPTIATLSSDGDVSLYSIN